MDILTLILFNSMSRFGIFKTTRHFFVESARRQIREEMISVIIRKSLLAHRLAQLEDPKQKALVLKKGLELCEKEWILHGDLLLTL